MPDLQTAFDAAVAQTQQLSERPDNATLLRLYALYKQATLGDAGGDRPGMTDFVARAKHDAWAALAGTPADEARQRYIDLFETLG